MIKILKKIYYCYLYKKLVFAYLKFESTAINAYDYANDTFEVIINKYYIKE